MRDSIYETFEEINDFMYSLYLETNDELRAKNTVRFLDSRADKERIVVVYDESTDSYTIKLSIKLYFNNAFLWRAGFEFNDCTERTEDFVIFKYRDSKEMQKIIHIASIINDSLTEIA